MITEGVHSATLDIYARISTLSGRIVQTFEDTIRQEFSGLSTPEASP